MKIFKVLTIILIASIGFVACEKRSCEPNDTNKNEATKTANRTSKGNTDDSNTSVNINSSNLEIVGSGDDDRDGGDKKKRNLVK
jgi:hypothetical protein